MGVTAKGQLRSHIRKCLGNRSCVFGIAEYGPAEAFKQDRQTIRLELQANYAATDSETGLTVFLGPPLQKVEQDIDTAVSSIENAKSNAAEALQGLVKEIASLVSLGRLFSTGQGDEDASAFVSEMRQVDSEAELLKNATPTELGRAVRKLTDFLVDSTYVVVQDVNPNWDSQAARLDSLPAKILEQLKLM